METPPPFGDPTQIQRENNSAVTKGVLFGCGGCLVLIGMGLAGIAAIFFFVMGALRSTDACQSSLTAARSSEILRQELGEPIEMGWFVTGNIKTNNGEGNADVSVPISGPKGSATIHTVGQKKSGGPWIFSEMQATVEKTGQTVDLKKP